MSTNSTIAVVHANGTVSQIYVHWDGHVDTAGKCLIENYNTLEQAEALVALGNLSELYARLAPDANEAHSFERGADGVCVAYARDRGEEGAEAEVFGSHEEFREEARCEEYDYFFVAGHWFVREQSEFMGTVIERLGLSYDDYDYDLDTVTRGWN
jgi:hypothetical protein